MIWPPTPTPYPPGQAFFSLPQSEMSLWNSAEWSIQTWHTVGSGQLLIQLLLMSIVIVAGYKIVMFAFERMIRRDAES